MNDPVVIAYIVLRHHPVGLTVYLRILNKLAWAMGGGRQTCQVTLIWRVRPHFDHSTLILLFKFCIGINGVTLISIFAIPYIYFALRGGAKDKMTLI